jgi:hypothetical protein
MQLLKRAEKPGSLDHEQLARQAERNRRESYYLSRQRDSSFKNSCSILKSDDAGLVVLKTRLHRNGMIKFAAGLAYPNGEAPVGGGGVACSIAHMWTPCWSHRLPAGFTPRERMMETSGSAVQVG